MICVSIFREECIRALPDVPEDGKAYECHLVSVPCAVWITKRRSQRPSCLVGRYLPKNQADELYSGMLTALQSKSKQFTRFNKGLAYRTFLLETEDYSSLDESTIPDIFSLAVPQCDLSPIDEVYLLSGTPMIS